MKFAFGPLVKTICKLSGFLFACYTGTMLLWQIVSLISIFQCLAVCCAIHVYGKKYQNLYVFLI